MAGPSVDATSGVLSTSWLVGTTVSGPPAGVVPGGVLPGVESIGSLAGAVVSGVTTVTVVVPSGVDEILSLGAGTGTGVSVGVLSGMLDSADSLDGGPGEVGGKKTDDTEGALLGVSLGGIVSDVAVSKSKVVLSPRRVEELEITTDVSGASVFTLDINEVRRDSKVVESRSLVDKGTSCRDVTSVLLRLVMSVVCCRVFSEIPTTVVPGSAGIELATAVDAGCVVCEFP